MKTRSILFKIQITFLISFLLLSISVGFLYHVLNVREEFFLRKRGIEIAKIYIHDLNSNLNETALEQEMKKFNFSLISDESSIQKILNQNDFKKSHFEFDKGFKLKYCKTDTRYFLYLSSPNKSLVLIDQNTVKNYLADILAIYFSMFAIFLFLYLSIIRRLAPLGQLHEFVKNVGDEKFDIDLTLYGNDEITALTNEFKQSAKKLKQLKESRNIFIRNMMHELKTPIAKGKFILQLQRTDENQQKMEKVFYRLESLINEFAMIEELVSVNKKLHVREYYLEDIIDNAEDILLCDPQEVDRSFENRKIFVDFDLFSIAIKNILDNGIKYSSNRKISIKTEEGCIVFENSSKPFEFELENYCEPFFRGNNPKMQPGFGLGLYIVKHIMDAHNAQIKYEYENGFVRIKIYNLLTRENL